MIPLFTETSNLLMAVNSNEEFSMEVEILSLKGSTLCSESVRNINIPNQPLFNFVSIRRGPLSARDGGQDEFFRDPVGLTSNNDIMVCGGGPLASKDRFCFAFDPDKNEWRADLSTLERRMGASSVLDRKGNMWVLGGNDGVKKSTPSTEVFDFGLKRWRQGEPLPSSFRDSGLSNHCAVRYCRSTLVFK